MEETTTQEVQQVTEWTQLFTQHNIDVTAPILLIIIVLVMFRDSIGEKISALAKQVPAFFTWIKSLFSKKKE